MRVNWLAVALCACAAACTTETFSDTPVPAPESGTGGDANVVDASDVDASGSAVAVDADVSEAQVDTSLGSCPAGFMDCDGDPAHRCETNIETSATNCGVCGQVCPAAPNAHGQCEKGVCILVCQSGYASCDGDESNGCETHTASDLQNCGACKHVCGDAHGAPACVSGQCGIDCTTGFGDCDADNGNGCESELTNSAAHCGWCGHDCLGASCQANLCQPTLLTTFPNPAVRLAAWDVNLYVVVSNPTGALIVRVPKTGGGSSDLRQLSAVPTSIAVDAGGVFTSDTSNGGQILVTALNGSSTSPLAQGYANPAMLVLDDSAAYWAFVSSGEARVAWVPKQGTKVTPLPAAQEIDGVAVDTTDVYWTSRQSSTDGGGGSTGYVNSIAKAGGQAQAPAVGSFSPGTVRVDADRLYWTDVAGNELMTVPKQGGRTDVIFDGYVGPDFAIDETHLYWIGQGTKTVHKLSKSGGPARLLVSLSQAMAANIAVDGTHLYWATVDTARTSAWKVAK